MDIQQSLFSLPTPTKRLTSHGEKMKFILETYASRGLTLEAIASAKVLNRTPSVLKRYCRKHLISFPDYTPFANRVKNEKQA